MRVLFSMRHFGFLRMYESVLVGLASRGHEVVIAADRHESLGWEETADRLSAEHPTISWSWSVRLGRSDWYPLAKTVRLWHDYLRFFDPIYDETPKLRERARELVAPELLGATSPGLMRRAGPRRALQAALRGIERAIPTDAALEAAILEQHPDVVLITPLVFLGSPQFEIMKATRALGLPTALCVGSWDHLSSKALLREMPERVLLWNPVQRQEAQQFHGVPDERIVVTGAQCYDQWFDRRPSRSREALARQVGLDPSRPYVMYVCSALFRGSPSEAAFVRRWVEAVRTSSHEEVRHVGILVRPHPARMYEWDDVSLEGFENVALYGSNPVDEAAKNDYFDSLYYSAAVAGLNTSAFLEGAVVGRPVHTILLPEFFENQEGTLHFRYLQTVGGGLLHAGRTFDEHCAELAATLRAGEVRDPRSDAFVDAFIRPLGRDVNATGRFIEAVEELGTLGVAPSPSPLWARAARPAMRALAAVSMRTVARRFGERTLAEKAREREQVAKAAARERALVEKATHREQAARGKEEELARKHAARAARVSAREAARAEAHDATRRARDARAREKEKAADAHRARKRRAALIGRLRRMVGLHGR